MTLAKSPYRSLLHNHVSYAGAALALVSVILLVYILILEMMAKHPNPYIGIATYLILPATLTIGLVVIPIGMGLENRRRRRSKDLFPGMVPLPYPIINLNLFSHQRLFGLWAICSGIVLLLLAVVAYRGYQFTESSTFCGQLCHQVMKPEYVAYSVSPHSRIECADCHIGPGASWFVRSKLAGATQVVSVLTNSYPRPIPTPIENLRPARDVCEQCHWPDKFFGDRMITRIHILPDEKNTNASVSLVMRTGGGGDKVGSSIGIHWHTDPDIEVSYVAADENRGVIPWVAVRGKDGRTVEYVSVDIPNTTGEAAGRERRTMDCIDCHNRPTHIYQLPEDAVDELIGMRKIDSSLPYIRKVAVEALKREYASQEDASTGIASEIRSFYKESYLKVSSERSQAIDQATAYLTEVYRRNVFPQMNIEWGTYPNNIGHKDSPGCFRCHDGKHVAQDGSTIRLECNICHSVPQGGDSAPAGLYPLLLAEPTTHRQPGWIPGHAKAFDSTCQSCHTQTFCDNRFCHGPGWLNRGGSSKQE